MEQEVEVHTGLPPQVDGQLRCFCKLTISQIVWTFTKHPDVSVVRVQWWGEDGKGSIFRPLDVKKNKNAKCQITARYPVRSGPCQFATYLSDMGSLTLEVLSMPGSRPVGQALVNHLDALSLKKPINGFFPVLSDTGQKIANLQVSLILEPISASFDSKSSVPTPDVPNVEKNQDFLVTPAVEYPTPHSALPDKPKNAVFMSPPNTSGLPGKSKSKKSQGRLESRFKPSSETFSLAAQNNHSHFYNSPPKKDKPNTDASIGKDLLSVLVEKGNKLREAMVVSSMHMDGNPAHINIPNSMAGAGSTRHLMTEGLVEQPKHAVDLLLSSPVGKQDFQLYQLMNGVSPGSSLSSDAGYEQMFSEPEDPLHENSILKELFYYNSEFQEHPEIAGLVPFSHIQSGNHLEPFKLLGGAAAFPMDDPGNQRPPSRTSSLTSLAIDDPSNGKKTKRKARSRKRSTSNNRSGSNSRSNSRSRSRSNTPSRQSRAAKSVEKDASSINAKVKSKKLSRSRSSSRSQSRTRKSKKKIRGRDGSESDNTITSKSDYGKTKNDGLSVERLTLLGRVHVARVNIDQLSLNKGHELDLSKTSSKSTKPPKSTKPKKPYTYFVEYQFPVFTTSTDKYSRTAPTTEVTRVASKNVKNGAVVFSHRAVFPLAFDGTSVELWWKTALVFRVFAKEAGGAPVLIGSGGLSLKSVLRSDSLFVQRDIEIPDTLQTSQMDSSRSSFNTSISSRTGKNMFGALKVSIQLGSDSKDFPTVLARTKVAELKGSVKIVPVGRNTSQQSELLKQLEKNKDQPIVKDASKKIEFLPSKTDTGTNKEMVRTLPPQSPRRKVSSSPSNEPEEGNEIAKLKQQLKATLAVLGSQNEVPAHMNAGSQILPGNSHDPAPTLHTMLLVQEGRNISITGVPSLNLASKNPSLLKAQGGQGGRDEVTRNTYLACRMFWCNDAVHSDVCWGTLNPEFQFVQVAPVLMTPPLLERMRDNYMIIEVWDKKVSAESDQLIGIVKLSLHQFYLSFRDRKIANALLKSQYPVLAVDNYMPIVDLFSGLHFGQLKVMLAMGSKEQISTLQRVAMDTSGLDNIPQQPSSFYERQDLSNKLSNVPKNHVEHQFELTIEGIRGLNLFEKMMWGEADCFVQFFFPSESETPKDGSPLIQSLPSMKCFRTQTTLCVPDPTFHDSSRHKITLPAGTPVQRDLLTACANSGDGLSGLPFEIWCRYYHPNVRDQLIAKCTLPLAKLCAMITMHKHGESCVQSFSLRLSHVTSDGKNDAELAAKTKDAGLLDLTVNYKKQTSQIISAPISMSQEPTQVCLSVGVLRACGLKAAAECLSELDPSMSYPADVGVNAYVRISVSFLGKETERVTKTVARSFAPELNHFIDFPCPLLLPQRNRTESCSLGQLLETGEVHFELWHQQPTGISQDVQQRSSNEGISGRRLVHTTSDVMLGTTILPLVTLLSKRTGISGWFAITLPSSCWGSRNDNHMSALDQVVGGLELTLRFSHQDDREKIINSSRSLGWSPLDLDVDQTDWQEENSHRQAHQLEIGVDQVSFPFTAALSTGQTTIDPSKTCYVRYKLYDKAAVVSKCMKLEAGDSDSLQASVNHRHKFMFSHSSTLQWYLREERLEIQVWVSSGGGNIEEKQPRQRDKLVGSCFVDLESLADMRRRQQRVSGLFPVFKAGSSNLHSAFVRAQITSSLRQFHDESDTLMTSDGDYSQTYSDTDQDSMQQLVGDLMIKKSKKSRRSKKLDPSESFSVLLAVERAMHLPMVTEKNRSGEVSPTTYVSYQSAERSNPSYSSIVSNSTCPHWDYAVETRLTTQYLNKENKNLVLKVWHKPCDAAKSPDKSSDRVLGFVSVDLSPLTKGLQQICGWYNITDFTGQCRGQIKVSITPQDLKTSGGVTSSPSSSFFFPSYPNLSMSSNTQSVAATIAQQLANLQSHVAQRLGHLTGQTSDHASISFARSGDSFDVSHDSVTKERTDFSDQQTTSQNVSQAPGDVSSLWTPRCNVNLATNDPSKSYLFSSLRKQLQDLDSITEKLRNKLTIPSEMDTSQTQINSARSGEILTGTQSGLSTIHTNSSIMYTQHSSDPSRPNMSSVEVGTSQDSARSRTQNNSSFEQIEKDNPNLHKLQDSGVFTHKTSSIGTENNQLQTNIFGDHIDSSESSSKLSEFKDKQSQNPDVIEEGFLNSVVDTIQTTTNNTIIEGSQNSRGFVLNSKKNSLENDNYTESNSATMFSNRKMIEISENTAGSNLTSDESKHQAGFNEQEVEFESEEEEEKGGGDYHKYRDLLNEEEFDNFDNRKDDEVVEVVPKSLNNMSSVLALNDRPLDDGDSNRNCVDDIHKMSPANAGRSPSVYGHEGTSIWYSDDNDDSFFQQENHKPHESDHSDGIDKYIQDLAQSKNVNINEAVVHDLFDKESESKHRHLQNWLLSQDNEADDEVDKDNFIQTEADADLVYQNKNEHDSLSDKEKEFFDKQTASSHINHVTDENIELLSVKSSDDADTRAVDVLFMTEKERSETPQELFRTEKEHLRTPDEFTILERENHVADADYSSNSKNGNDIDFNYRNSPVEEVRQTKDQENSKNMSLQKSDFQKEFGEGARPKAVHLLSNVDLDSISSSQQRPRSGSSQRSKSSVKSNFSDLVNGTNIVSNHDFNTATHTQNQILNANFNNNESKNTEFNTNRSRSNEITDTKDDDVCSIPSKNKLDSMPNSHIETSNTIEPNNLEGDINLNNSSAGHFVEVLQDEFTSEPVLITINKTSKLVPLSTENESNLLCGTNSIENGAVDSVIIDGTKIDNDASLSNTSELQKTNNDDAIPVGTDKPSIPNFFMPSEDMLLSIKALQMASSAAAKLSEEDIKAESKLKAVTQLVKKMSGDGSSRARAKSKELPSQEQAQRIARIFNSKFT